MIIYCFKWGVILFLDNGCLSFLKRVAAGLVESQVVECLPGKCEALSSNPWRERDRERERERERE
jgi:hypothetical protein